MDIVTGITIGALSGCLCAVTIVSILTKPKNNWDFLRKMNTRMMQCYEVGKHASDGWAQQQGSQDVIDETAKATLEARQAMDKLNLVDDWSREQEIEDVGVEG